MSRAHQGSFTALGNVFGNEQRRTNNVLPKRSTLVLPNGWWFPEKDPSPGLENHGRLRGGLADDQLEKLISSYGEEVTMRQTTCLRSVLKGSLMFRKRPAVFQKALDLTGFWQKLVCY